MLASLLSLIEPDAYMQKLTYFSVSKLTTKFPWMHRVCPQNLWAVGRSL